MINDFLIDPCGDYTMIQVPAGQWHSLVCVGKWCSDILGKRCYVHAIDGWQSCIYKTDYKIIIKVVAWKVQVTTENFCLNYVSREPKQQ